MHILISAAGGRRGLRMAALLERKLAEGVDVRVIVDGFGSGRTRRRAMFAAAARAQIVVNDLFPPDRDAAVASSTKPSSPVCVCARIAPER